MDWQQYEQLIGQKNKGTAGGTMVVFDKNHRALYFSKNIIPYLRTENRSKPPPIWLHIGLYGYRLRALEKYAEWEPSRLEKAEQLEQLRAMENGLPITIVPVDYRGRTAASIDNPDDVAIVEDIISRGGELVPLK
jgi:3-deoxy-manno-octulosonate cytidylyltransferase (CMP-KDO synthetase)